MTKIIIGIVLVLVITIIVFMIFRPKKIPRHPPTVATPPLAPQSEALVDEVLELRAGETFTKPIVSPDGQSKLVREGDALQVIKGGEITFNIKGAHTILVNRDGGADILDKNGNSIVKGPGSILKQLPTDSIKVSNEGTLQFWRGDKLLFDSKRGPTLPDELKRGETLSGNLQSPNGEYQFVRQQMGSFVILKQMSSVVWTTNTQVGGTTFIHQGDGNLVVYDSSGKPLWASGTAGRATTTLKLMDTGKLVLLNEQEIIWSSE
jgi:hypothetical protein